MKVEHTVAGIQAWRNASQSDKVSLVPTMGNLHEGHLKLVEQACKLSNAVAVSIFVNPTQFGPNEDYERYPRTLEEDCTKLKKAGVNVVFCPSVEEMYPNGPSDSTKVLVPALSNILCGASRPGHFDGVTTVVNRLFNIVKPDIAIFGEKDYQQLLVIRRMVQDLFMPIEVIGVETHREIDGLAMSSRNQYLTSEERAIAPKMQEILQFVGQQIKDGENQLSDLQENAKQKLIKSGFQPDYVSIRRAEDLSEPEIPQEGMKIRILGAAKLGKARLIDNIAVSLSDKKV